MRSFKVVMWAGIAPLVALAIFLVIDAKVAQAQTLFGLAYSGPDGLSTLYRINTATGGFDPVGSGTGFQRCSGMDFDASGTLFATCERADGSNTNVLIIIDPSTGVGKGAEVRPTGVGSGPYSVVINAVSDISFKNSDGVLYAHLLPLNSLWTIGVKDSALSPIGETFIGGFGNGIAFSPENVLFHADNGTLNILDQLNGVGTLVADLVFSPPADDRPRINALDFQPDTGILYASLNDKPLAGSAENFLATIETTGGTSGKVTIIGPTVDGLDAIAFAPQAAASPQAELGDFKCYDVKKSKGVPKYEEVEVTLADEYTPESITRVRNSEVFCTPVSKDGAEIIDPTASLTCYNIKDVEGPPEEQDVVVENKFGGQQALTLKVPKLLCVPSTIVQ
jgi:hypothetical protein